MRKLKATDKITQKMTRDGAVSENLATGEVEHISSREPETELSASSEESAGAAADLALRAAEHHEKKSARKAEKADTQAVRDGSAARQRPSSRLQFTEEERADPSLGKYIDRSDRAADRLDAAKAAIPTKKVLRTERVFDETAGKGKTQLHFEEVEKRPNGRLRHNPLSRPVHEIVHAAHAKVHEVEQENVGVEAGHKGEVLTERGFAYGKGKVRAAVHHHRTKPWRDAAKAEQASFKANADYLYQKALHDDPALAASNPVSRFLQKQRIKRNYAKELRQAEKTAKNTAATAKSAAQKAKDAFQETFLYIKHHSRAVLLVIGIGACVALLFGGVSSCSMMAGSGVGGVFTSSYLSEDADMLAAEAAYCELEQELQYELDHYEALHPGYDEYRFDLDEIEHDPYVLIYDIVAGTFLVVGLGEDDFASLSPELIQKYTEQFKTPEQFMQINGNIVVLPVPAEKQDLAYLPDRFETGERVQTPRGSFQVTAMSREQMEAAGYGVHHISDDRKYLIMGNGTRAFAVAAEQPEKDNPLRTAEMTLEDDYGMINGVINNGRRGEELEKAQEYAERATPEKSSIRERLEDAKRECAEHKPQEGKKPGRDVPEQDCL